MTREEREKLIAMAFATDLMILFMWAVTGVFGAVVLWAILTGRGS